MQQRLLVVTPHPDDETIGSGATIARAVREGGLVLVLCATATPPRLRELEAACSVLDADYQVLFGGEYNSRLDTLAMHDVVHAIEEVVQTFNPQRVIQRSLLM